MQKALGGVGGKAAAAAAAGADGAAFGVLQNIHINPMPVRAAIDIGTGGVASLTVGRVDAVHNAVCDVMYQTQVPLHLHSATASSPLSSATASPFVLSEQTRTDIRNKMRLLHGALRRDHYEGLSERAALITWPLCDAADAVALAGELTREFKVDVRVLGKTFHVEMPFANHGVLCDAGDASSASKKKQELAERATGVSDDNDSLRVLMQRAVRRREERRRRVDAHDSSEAGAEHCVVPPQQQMEQLAFLAHAAASKCVAPQRMLVLAEDTHRGLCVLGTDTTEAEEVDDDGTCVVSQQQCEGSGVLTHALPIDATLAHRLLLTTVQRRAASHGSQGERCSPNPVLRDELLQLRSLLEAMVRPTLPPWVLRKSHAGGLVCGSSFNGGALNIAARVAQRTSVSLDHLETHAEMHYCGLTDVLLGMNYPDPTMVLPNAAVTSALMRAIGTHRFEYLPEVSLAAALLVQPSLWTHGRRERVRAALQQKAFYSGGSARRTFRRPHARENPTAAPEASWQRNQSWNPLSYENSTKGT
ncbi:hypothetical protein DQ04_03081020 [Trypanosoma grayi]|uniref:hypothetical protein n=1 Tax=Trypanosoma grayi TaxID=71804 RepID=UPI0004F48511|nr:hypothetical protein DQ04_03081020 [Trypanosoma grayi]KEG10986.1 hypothetical protein DQ04_03081020 [Trypanosoma grayi]